MLVGGLQGWVTQRLQGCCHLKGQFAKDLPGLGKATLTCRLLDVGRPLLSGDGLKGAVGEASGDRQELLVNLEKAPKGSVRLY